MHKPSFQPFICLKAHQLIQIICPYIKMISHCPLLVDRFFSKQDKFHYFQAYIVRNLRKLLLHPHHKLCTSFFCQFCIPCMNCIKKTGFHIIRISLFIYTADRKILCMVHLSYSLPCRIECFSVGLGNFLPGYDRPDARFEFHFHLLLHFTKHTADIFNLYFPLIIRFFLFPARDKDDYFVSHQRSYNSIHRLLKHFTENHAVLLQPDSCTYCVGQFSFSQFFSAFDHYCIDILRIDSKQLTVCKIGGIIALSKKNAVHKTTFDHRNHNLKFFFHLQILTYFFPSIIYKLHRLSQGIRQHVLIDRLCQIRHNADINSLL